MFLTLTQTQTKTAQYIYHNISLQWMPQFNGIIDEVLVGSPQLRRGLSNPFYQSFSLMSRTVACAEVVQFSLQSHPFLLRSSLTALLFTWGFAMSTIWLINTDVNSNVTLWVFYVSGIGTPKLNFLQLYSRVTRVNKRDGWTHGETNSNA